MWYTHCPFAAAPRPKISSNPPPDTPPRRTRQKPNLYEVSRAAWSMQRASRPPLTEEEMFSQSVSTPCCLPPNLYHSRADHLSIPYQPAGDLIRRPVIWLLQLVSFPRPRVLAPISGGQLRASGCLQDPKQTGVLTKNPAQLCPLYVQSIRT